MQETCRKTFVVYIACVCVWRVCVGVCVCGVGQQIVTTKAAFVSVAVANNSFSTSPTMGWLLL